MTEDLATARENWRFEILTVKVWLLSVNNWEDDTSWYLPMYKYVYFYTQKLCLQFQNIDFLSIIGHWCEVC